MKLSLYPGLPEGPTDLKQALECLVTYDSTLLREQGKLKNAQQEIEVLKAMQEASSNAYRDALETVITNMK